jgi:DNA polymerase-1
VGQARAFIDAYFSRYPGIRSFIDRCVENARQTGYAQTILGRRRPIQELQSRNRQQVALGERVAVNTVVQGSAADLIKRAMIDIHQAFKAGRHTARMVIQVHDELVFEVPSEHVEREARLIREKMEKAIELDVPIVVDVAWGRTWAESK